MKFFTRTKIISAAIILLVIIIGGIMYGSGGSNETWLTEAVKKQDITQTVLATGQVVSETDLNLSFKVSGVVQSVGVKVGDKVKAGQVIATLDQKDQLASVTSARGALASADANYKKVLAGASSEEVVVAQKAVDAAQTTLDNAKKNAANVKEQQQLLVDNAYKMLLNSTFVAVEDQENEGTASVTITGTYTGTETGTYTIETYVYGSKGLSFTANGLEQGS
jgi:multidrug efflux pump subunit AcrA (membrane-fusion protein)